MRLDSRSSGRWIKSRELPASFNAAANEVLVSPCEVRKTTNNRHQPIAKRMISSSAPLIQMNSNGGITLRSMRPHHAVVGGTNREDVAGLIGDMAASGTGAFCAMRPATSL